jgi:S1-C subfamily serine protease
MKKYALVYALIGLASAVAISCGGGGGSKDPTATAVPQPMDPAAILNANKTSVVKIEVSGPDGNGWGSGIVYQDGTHVLTNAHVVVGAGSVKVVDPADGTRSFPAKVVALSSCDDVALLSIDRAVGLTPAKLGDSAKLQPGQQVVTLGFPGTLSTGPSNPIITQGNVSRINATFASGGQRDLVQHTAPINPGNSGGPLFNMFGEVVGINSYYAYDKQAENYAITIHEAVAIAEKLKAGKNLDYIGISLTPNYRQLAVDWDLPYIDGLVITGIDPGSPADKAKLDTGYLIFELNGTSVETVGQFCDVVRSQSSGSTLRVRFGWYDTAGKPFSNFVYDVIVP